MSVFCDSCKEEITSKFDGVGEYKGDNENIKNLLKKHFINCNFTFSSSNKIDLCPKCMLEYINGSEWRLKI